MSIHIKHPEGRPLKILIIKLSAIGDVVQSLCVLDALKHRYPNAKIDWLAGEAAAGLIQGHPMLENVIVYPRRRFGKLCAAPPSWPALLSEGRGFLKELRSREYDTVVDLQGLLKSGVLTWLSRGRRKIGFASGREGSSLFLNEKLPPYDPDEHAVLRYMRIAHHLGADTDREPRFPLGTGPQEIEKAHEVLERHGLEAGRIIGLIPGTRWETKHWTSEGFAATADIVRSRMEFEPVILGGPGDGKLAAEISRLAARPVPDLTGTTDLKTLGVLFQMTAAVITTDTGPMHLAAAAGTPVVALFGPTAPNRTGPFSPRARVVCRGYSCSPCFQRKCCEEARCMKDITPQEVMESLTALVHI